MNTTYETEHLEMRVLRRDAARLVTDFYARNAKEFAKYEPLSLDNAKNLNYHGTMLDYEWDYFQKNQILRLYCFEKDNPFVIVGTLSFRNIAQGFYRTATLGYKMDKDYRRRGYMREAIARGMEVMDQELHLHRIEAVVMPDNLPSIRLLEGLDFQREGLLRDKIKLNGKWEDHYLYTHIWKHNP